MAFQAKVYIVQRANRDGTLLAEVPIAAKLTHADAMQVATTRGIAPAKITMIIADKNGCANGPGQIGHHDVCASLKSVASRKRT